jgi:hypothetical protein
MGLQIEICDSTCYLLALCVYTGKDTKLDSLFIRADTNETTATVLKLTEPLL